MANYTGTLASGRRVYVRDLVRMRARGLGRPLAFAVFADTGRVGRLQIVDRVEVGDHQAICCVHSADGAAHDGPCLWAAPATLSPRAYAALRVHWWTHVARTTAEAVELERSGDRKSRGARLAPRTKLPGTGLDRLVRERVAQTGETTAAARDQLQPRAASPRRYARSRETTIEALGRAYRDDLPVIAYVRAEGPERVTISAALRLLEDGRVERFAVLLRGREVPL